MNWITREKIKGPRGLARFVKGELEAKRYKDSTHCTVERHDDTTLSQPTRYQFSRVCYQKKPKNAFCPVDRRQQHAERPNLDARWNKLRQEAQIKDANLGVE